MNIGIDIRPALNEKTGVGNYALNLVAALVDLDRENQYQLFSSSFRDRFHFPQIQGFPNWQLKDYRCPNRLMSYLWRQGGLPVQLLLRGLDVFHFTGAIAPALKSIAAIATAYDVYHLRHPESVEPRHRIPLEALKRNLEDVSKIIAISEFTKSDLVELLGLRPEKIEVVPLGVDTRIFKPVADHADYLKKRFALEGDYLLHVGTLENRKNLIPLLEAFGLILKRFPHVKLVLAGKPGEGFERIREKVRSLSLEASILFLGYIESDADLPYLYSGASALVFPSLYEGFGLPVLEAFACGTPVAASNCSSIPEIAGDAALLFDPRQPDDIAHNIMRLLEDSQLVLRLRDKACARVKAFSWAATAHQTLRVYEACGGKR